MNRLRVANFLTELNATEQPQDLGMLTAHDLEASHFSEISYGPEVVQTTEPAGFLLENTLYSNGMQIEEPLSVCC